MPMKPKIRQVGAGLLIPSSDYGLYEIASQGESHDQQSDAEGIPCCKQGYPYKVQCERALCFA